MARLVRHPVAWLVLAVCLGALTVIDLVAAFGYAVATTGWVGHDGGCGPGQPCHSAQQTTDFMLSLATPIFVAAGVALGVAALLATWRLGCWTVARRRRAS